MNINGSCSNKNELTADRRKLHRVRIKLLAYELGSIYYSFFSISNVPPDCKLKNCELGGTKDVPNLYMHELCFRLIIIMVAAVRSKSWKCNVMLCHVLNHPIKWHGMLARLYLVTPDLPRQILCMFSFQHWIQRIRKSTNRLWDSQ